MSRKRRSLTELLRGVYADEGYDPADNASKCYDLAVSTLRDKLESFRCERIGPHKLYLGDCTKIMPLLGSVDAVVTDPPYGNSNHDGDYNASLNAHRGIKDQPIANDDQDSMRTVVDAMLTQAVGLLGKEASACCCFCGGGGAEAAVCVACRANGSRRTPVLPFSHLGQEEPRPRSALSQAA